MTKENLVLKLDSGMVRIDTLKRDLEAAEVFLYDMVEEAEIRELRQESFSSLDYFTRRLRGTHSLLERAVKELNAEIIDAKEVVSLLRAQDEEGSK